MFQDTMLQAALDMAKLKDADPGEDDALPDENNELGAGMEDEEGEEEQEIDMEDPTEDIVLWSLLSIFTWM